MLTRIKTGGKILLCGIITASILCGCAPAAQLTQPTTTVPTVQTTVPTTVQTEPTQPTTIQTEPQPEIFTLSFAGDCTLGTEYDTYGSGGSFIQVIGENYQYPLQNVLAYFGSDDFTMVNLEGALTEFNIPVEKEYRFRGPSEYAKILTLGSVEAVNLANNHSYDYGETGYADTKAALTQENITFAGKNETAFFVTQRGLKIGIYCAQFYINNQNMEQSIADLRSEGAQIVVASFHWGTEGNYIPDDSQKTIAYDAIDAGADIVFGHHPHVLQPIEQYKDGVIYYSLGNFSFGGNRNPKDKDTAIIQQTVIVEPDGTVRLGETTPIPCRLSSVPDRNDYQPTPYDVGSDAYYRTLSKLDGTFATPAPTEPVIPETQPAEPTPATENTQPTA